MKQIYLLKISTAMFCLCFLLLWHNTFGQTYHKDAGITCRNADPFCSNEAYQFPASTNVSSLGTVGCLTTTPNPVWYWMQIDDPGDITIRIEQNAINYHDCPGGLCDVDFIAWGPFNSLEEACENILLEPCTPNCTNNQGEPIPNNYPRGNIVDCSYRSDAIEYCHIRNAQNGQVYVLLMTNYSRKPANISFKQTTGNASSNCGIIAPQITANDPLCVGESLILNVAQPVANANYHWTGPNGFSAVQNYPNTNLYIENITTEHEGQYCLYVSYNGQASPSTCIDIVINEIPNPTINNNTGSSVLTCEIIQINLTANGATSYQWSGGNSITTANNQIIEPGIYTVTCTHNNCTATESITITQDINPNNIEIINNTGISEINCTYTSVSLTAVGNGNIIWSNGSNQENIIISEGGTYTATLTATNGCTSTKSEIITQNNILPTTKIVNNTETNTLTCTTTTIDLTAEGGDTYQWSIGATTANISISTPGTYKVTATLANGCTHSTNITIQQNINNPTAIITNDTETEILTCNVPTISLTASGGDIYIWSNGSTTQNINITTQNQYSVTVIDANNNCSDIKTVNITENKIPPVPIITNLNGESEINCTIKSINLVASGGSTYHWNTGNSSSSIVVRVAGTYNVTVTNINGCTATESVTITEGYTTAIPVELILEKTVSCHGFSDASIKANVTDNRNGISYLWNNNSTSDTNSGLSAGEYSVTITDQAACVGVNKIIITEPAQLLIQPIIQNVKCYGEDNGNIKLNVNGGTAPYNYIWSNGQSSNPINSLKSGKYQVTVYDKNNCYISSDNYYITEPQELKLHHSIKNVKCYGNDDGAVTINASGGTMPYFFTIYNDMLNIIPKNKHNNLYAGNYTLKVEDINVCYKVQDITIIQPNKLNVSYSTIDPSCFGNKDGSISLSISGGIEPYIYHNNNNHYNDPVFSNLGKGKYYIKVIDSNYCEYIIEKVELYDDYGNCITIPSSFTPNGDGINDTWIIENLEVFPDAQVCVFNRWGQKIYHGKFGDEPWDGTYNGKKLAAAPYVYMIILFNDIKPYSGVVTVIY